MRRWAASMRMGDKASTNTKRIPSLAGRVESQRARQHAFTFTHPPSCVLFCVSETSHSGGQQATRVLCNQSRTRLGRWGYLKPLQTKDSSGRWAEREGHHQPASDRTDVDWILPAVDGSCGRPGPSAALSPGNPERDPGQISHFEPAMRFYAAITALLLGRCVLWASGCEILPHGTRRSSLSSLHPALITNDACFN